VRDDNSETEERSEKERGVRLAKDAKGDGKEWLEEKKYGNPM
jgi:hypothetical protein